MPDNLLLLVFGTLSTIALGFGVFATYRAVKSARKQDGEIPMALWSVAALAGFTFAGMSWAYFLIPIFLTRLFR